MQEEGFYSPMPRFVQRITAYVIETVIMHGEEFIATLKHAANAIWEDTRRTPERVLAELQSYGVIEIVSLVVSMILLAIVLLVAAANAVQMY